MATINEDIAIAAQDEGWLFAELTENQKLLLHPQVVTMNRLCRIIKDNPNIRAADVTQLAGIHSNTCYTYLRWMRQQGILRIN